jgi:predicted nucleic acid-binding protein
MIVYAESSAVLAWLLGERRGEEAAAVLSQAAGVVASDVTLVECERVLIRAWSTGLMTEAEGADMRAVLHLAAAHWTRLRLDGEVVERALRPFPVEPVRTLDALHLASALVARSAAPGLRLLTLDQRILENGERLGLAPLP